MRYMILNKDTIRLTTQVTNKQQKLLFKKAYSKFFYRTTKKVQSNRINLIHDFVMEFADGIMHLVIRIHFRAQVGPQPIVTWRKVGWTSRPFDWSSSANPSILQLCVENAPCVKTIVIRCSILLKELVSIASKVWYHFGVENLTISITSHRFPADVTVPNGRPDNKGRSFARVLKSDMWFFCPPIMHVVLIDGACESKDAFARKDKFAMKRRISLKFCYHFFTKLFDHRSN